MKSRKLLDCILTHSLLMIISLTMLVPSVLARDSSDIVHDIRQQLTAAEHLGRFDVGVHARAGKVTLTGLVDSAQLDEELVRLARRTPGVYSVHDQLSVAPEQLRQLDRSAHHRSIIQGIHQELMRHPALTDFVVYVSLQDGVAKLTGVVNSEKQSQLVAHLTAADPHVVRVINLLVVEDPSPRTDSATRDSVLERRVSTCLRKAHDLSSANVEISASKGEVTLSGDMQSFRQVDKLLATTMMVHGVTQLHSNLTVNGRPYEQAWKASKS